MQDFKLFGGQGFFKGRGEPELAIETGVFVNREGEPTNGQVPKDGRGDAITVSVSGKELLAINDEIAREFPQPGKYIQKQQGVEAEGPAPEGFVSPASVDVPLVAASLGGGQYWHIGGYGNHSFGNVTDALTSMGLSSPVCRTRGEDIGVVIVDSGISRDYVDAMTGRNTYAGGWRVTGAQGLARPGQAKQPFVRLADMHGNMIARNILKVAPAATLYDAPLLPDRITDLQAFSSVATALMRGIATVIRLSEHIPIFPQHKHWIVVNAWAAATTMAEPPGVVSYAANRGHRLNAAVIDLANLDNVEVVFAAGNAGAFQPARFTGPYDVGHARSIWGCNGLPEVHTIGAVRTDGISIGASSQGPSRPELLVAGAVNQKPDFVAPSWFREVTNPSVLNTGTSAACALFAGMLAHVASADGPATSAVLRAKLDAMPGDPGGWSAQRGRGPVKVA